MSKVWATKVKPTTIQNCFRKAGFTLDTEDDIPLSNLANLLREERQTQEERCEMERNFGELPVLVTFDDYCDVDNDILCHELMTDVDIIDCVEVPSSTSEDSLTNEMDTSD